MKLFIKELVQNAIASLQKTNVIDKNLTVQIPIERCRNPDHGDFACSVSMVLAKQVGRSPRELAEQIKDHIKAPDLVEKIDIAGPGFINFTLTREAYCDLIKDILEKQTQYGKMNLGKGKRIHIEIVSANPTGPLHVGHGRSAAFGASLSNLLEETGFDVYREYYVNDAGRQMHILATSLWIRYLEKCGENIPFPTNAYRGEYLYDIVQALHDEYGTRFLQPANKVMENIPEDEIEPGRGDKEAHIDALIERAKQLLGDDYKIIFEKGLTAILDDIKDDLETFGLTYQNWFHESELHNNKLIEHAIEKLKTKGHTYERQNALWFRSTDFADDKDRVLIRENGVPTYFAADVANHLYKYERGFKSLINILGADHHGYIARLKASIQALGYPEASLELPIVQFAVLYRGKQKIKMSTRQGEFVTLRELYQEVGIDAVRFFYILRKPEQHMDFDLELAKSQSSDNPVYYVQYAYARICSVFRQLNERQQIWDKEKGLKSFDLLKTEHEKQLMVQISRYCEVIESASKNHEPHLIAHYLRELADHFHSYYNAHIFLTDDDALTNARLTLIAATKIVFYNGLTILGVSAPELM